nr:unnamed protein product [Digitaria exilis]
MRREKPGTLERACGVEAGTTEKLRRRTPRREIADRSLAVAMVSDRSKGTTLGFCGGEKWRRCGVGNWMKTTRSQTGPSLSGPISVGFMGITQIFPTPPPALRTAISLAGTLDAAIAAAAGTIPLRSFSSFKSKPSVYSPVNPVP